MIAHYPPLPLPRMQGQGFTAPDDEKCVRFLIATPMRVRVYTAAHCLLV